MAGIETQTSATPVKVTLPFGIGEAEWVPSPAERKAAWALYLEIITRLPIVPYERRKGLLRDSLNLLSELFEAHRKILRAAGAQVCHGRNSVGGIAINVLRFGIRPFLDTWHPLLLTWEQRSISQLSAKEHEMEWPQERRLRAALQMLNEQLEVYASALAQAAGIDEGYLLPETMNPYEDMIQPQIRRGYTAPA